MESVQSANQIHGSARVQPRLSKEGVAVLSAALDSAIATRNPASSEALNHALKRICIDARGSEWPPEWLLIAFKSALYTLPALEGLTRGPERDEFVARLVSLCIDEFYLRRR
jgi:hypothetical protein